MKKCLIFFTLLLITIGIAVVTEKKEAVADINDMALTEATVDDALPEEKVLALD